MGNTIQPIPINLQPTPGASSLPPQVAAMLQQAQEGAQQSAQPSQEAPPPMPLDQGTQMPPFSAIAQAGQGQFGVPGYNEQGQKEPVTGVKDRLKRALSDAVFAIGEGLIKGPGVGVLAATPQGREYIHQQRALAAQQAVAQQIQEYGYGTGRAFAGAGSLARGQADIQKAQAYSQSLVPALVSRMNAQVNELNVRAGAERYKVTPIGPFDTSTGQFVNGASYNQPVMVTKELVQEFPELRAFPIGEVLLPSQIATIARMQTFATIPVQTGAGPVLVNRAAAAQNMQGQSVSKPIGTPPVFAGPETVIDPNSGQPVTTTHGMAIAKGLTPISPSMGSTIAGTKGQLQDIQYNLNRMSTLVNSGVFNNLSQTDKAKIAYAINSKEGLANTVFQSDVLPHLTPQQVEAVSIYPQLQASISSMRQLLGKAPARTEKQWDQFMAEAPRMSELLAGSNVANTKIQAFQNAFDNLKGPMTEYFSGSPHPLGGKEGRGASPQKIAPMSAVEAYAQAAGITKAQALSRFKAKGYEIK